jgi:hypothetical protein
MRNPNPYTLNPESWKWTNSSPYNTEYQLFTLQY